MNETLLAYIERLEQMVFFVGYPLVYAIVLTIARTNQKKVQSTFFGNAAKLLPYAYALSGSLFFGLVLKNIYPDFSYKNIIDHFQNPFLNFWGILALLFWIPSLPKKTFLSLVHSLVFFFLLLKDLFMLVTSNSATDIIKNDMKIYTDSLILNAGTLATILLFFYLFSKIKRYSKR